MGGPEGYKAWAELGHMYTFSNSAEHFLLSHRWHLICTRVPPLWGMTETHTAATYVLDGMTGGTQQLVPH